MEGDFPADFHQGLLGMPYWIGSLDAERTGMGLIGHLLFPNFSTIHLRRVTGNVFLLIGPVKLRWSTVRIETKLNEHQ